MAAPAQVAGRRTPCARGGIEGIQPAPPSPSRSTPRAARHEGDAVARRPSAGRARRAAAAALAAVGGGECRHPLRGRCRVVVDDVEDPGDVAAERGDERGGGVAEVDEREGRAAAAPGRDRAACAPPPLGRARRRRRGRCRPVEPAEAQHGAAGFDGPSLELGDRGGDRLHDVAGPVAERVLLAGEPLTGQVHEGDALRDQPGAAGRLGGGDEVRGALGAEPVGRAELLDRTPRVDGRRDRGGDMEDRLRPPLPCELQQRIAVEEVQGDEIGATLRHRTGEPADLVAGVAEGRQRCAAEDSGCSRDRYPHGRLAQLRPSPDIW